MRVLGGRPGGVTSLHLDDGTEERARLVVVGNGMAGARFVEEVLERGGDAQFSITDPPGRSSTTRSGTWVSAFAPIGNQRIGSPSRSSST